MKNIFNLESDVILYTGGYGYLAAPSVKYLGESKAKVYVLARDYDKFLRTFSGFESVFFQECDIASTSSIRNAFRTVFEKEKKVDVLINNAFYLKGQSPERMTDEEFGIGVEGVLTATFKAIREIIPYFKDQRRGKIINFSSMYGMVAPDFTIYEESPEFLNPPHYGAAKAGVIQLTKYYASYLGKDNIQVNCLTPGPFPSDMVREKNRNFEQRLIKNTLLKRVGYPEDLIGVLILLASSASDYITGQNFVIDGGWTCK
jgi:NAD(P)-dependent dehydrogenase (short-subunit alcohol dehydrogenase family)